MTLSRLSTCLFMLLAACGSVVTSPAPSPDHDALPDSVVVPAGVVRVQLADSLWVPNRPDLFVLGRFDALTRTVYINKRIESPQQRQKTLHHEICHVVFVDAGIQLILSQALDALFIEQICDAFATARMAELSRR